MHTRTRYGFLAAAVILVTILGSMGCTARPTEGSAVVEPVEETARPDDAGMSDDAGQPQDVVPAAAGVLASDRPRETSPDVSASDLEALVAGNNAFAFELYQALRAEGKNLFASPFSVSLALAMTYAGARGETERQMADTLHFAPQAQLHRAFNALEQALLERGEDDEGFQLHIVNAIWGQRGHPFRTAFLDTLAENYGAGLRASDFVADPEAVRHEINDWVSEETRDKIEDLLPAGSLDPTTTLVLVNAIYFNAPWAEPFDEQGTAEAPFTLLDGTQTTVQMMRGTKRVRLAQGDGYQAIELPYKGDEMAMLILLPDEGRFEAVAGALDAEQVTEIVAGLQDDHVALHMPKFRYASGAQLSDALTEMGMPAAFSGADFSGMDGTKDLFIDEVYHKAFVSVDEQGTEAAAATAVVMSRLGMPQQLKVDRPFIYLIRDLETGTVLFVGQVADPSAS